MRFPSSLVAILIFGACSSDPEQPHARAREQGYLRQQELQDQVTAVEAIDAESWRVDLNRSARSMRVLRSLSNDADQLIARAKEFLQSGANCYLTILIHEDAPTTKLAPREAESDSAPYPWVLVRIGSEPDPALDHKR